MRILNVLACLLICLAVARAAVPPPGSCPGGTTLAAFELTIVPEEGESPVPVRSIPRLQGGAHLRYQPHGLYGADSKDAEVALITIPTVPTGVLGVLESHNASESAEWIVPSRAAAVALVYGPQGLNLGKIAELMRRDSTLILQLAAYAEKSAQTELLMETIADSERSGQPLESALAGFASRSGVALPVLTRGAPAEQQALTLMRALHPTLSTFDPFAPAPGVRLQQSASVAASVAGLFFGNPVGLATAGGAMFLNLRSLLFPGSEFRSALSQQLGDNAMLCAKRETAKSRTKLVYLWAWKFQGLPSPRFDGLPYRANLGAPSVRIPVRGANLENIRGVTSSRDGASIEYLPAESALMLTFPPDAKKGDKIDLQIEVEDSPAPLAVPAAIELLDPRPVLAGGGVSLPADLPLELAEGEIPASAFVAASLRATGAGPLPTLHLECSDPALTLKKLSLRPGEQNGGARLRSVTGGELFLSFEPGSVGLPPCDIAARIETGDGISEPVRLGRLVRLPRIDRFSMTPELLGAASSSQTPAYMAWIEGEELEAIERTGWQSGPGLAVRDAPLPVASSGTRQRLKVAMPWPPPAPRAPLYVWLRGEPAGRKTAVAY